MRPYDASSGGRYVDANMRPYDASSGGRYVDANMRPYDASSGGRYVDANMRPYGILLNTKNSLYIPIFTFLTILTPLK